MVARERFELSSRAPEAPMLDHYTTGLQARNLENDSVAANFKVLPGRCYFYFSGPLLCSSTLG